MIYLPQYQDDERTWHTDKAAAIREAKESGDPDAFVSAFVPRRDLSIDELLVRALNSTYHPNAYEWAEQSDSNPGGGLVVWQAQ